MKISDMSKEAYQNAKEHGWWEQPLNIPEKIALMHSELSEALEEYRINPDPEKLMSVYSLVDNKPEGFLTELADVIIRIGDLCGALNCADELERVVRLKMDYNKTRSYRHGNKAC